MSQLTTLVRRHHLEVLRIRARAQQLVTHTWIVHGGLTAADSAAFVDQTVPIIRAAQYRTAALMSAYLAAVAHAHGARPPAVIDPLLVSGANVRRGTEPAVVYERPIITARSEVAAGATYDVAMNRGLIRAVTLASTDVMLTNREAATVGMAADEQITGYRRVLSGQGCELCTEAADQLYSIEDLMPIHDHCECDVAPEYGTSNPAARLNDSVISDLASARPDTWDQSASIEDGHVVIAGEDGASQPLEIAVQDHGELGPVLTNAAHSFKDSAAAA